MHNLDKRGNGIEVNNKCHGPLLPSTIRGLIIEPSNCGKANVMKSLITYPHGIRFENIYLYSKSLYQPKYEYLGMILNSINGWGFYTFNNNTEIIVESSKAKPNLVFIFDVVICETQDVIRSYFCMGRHKFIDSIYLTQIYSSIYQEILQLTEIVNKYAFNLIII